MGSRQRMVLMRCNRWKCQSCENVVDIYLMKKENLKANRYITGLYERSPYPFPPQGTIPERLYNNDLIEPYITLLGLLPQPLHRNIM